MKKAILTLFPLLSYCMSHAQTYVNANFNANASGFVYTDNLFNGANAAAYATGSWSSNGGSGATGGLSMTLGGVDNTSVTNISGGWTINFTLAANQDVLVTFKFKFLTSGFYEETELSDVLLAIDNQIITNNASKPFIDQLRGFSTGGTGTQIGSNTFFSFSKVVSLTAGTHTLKIGGSNSAKNANNETTSYVFDDVSVAGLTDPCANPAIFAAQRIVNRASLDTFTTYLQTISSYGDRSQLNVPTANSYVNAEAWAIAKFQQMGYTVQYNTFTYSGETRRNIYATKTGTVNPQNMYIISGHLDGRGNGGGCNDDASGVALVMSVANVLSDPNIITNISVRFILWSSEEIGLVGSGAYVSSRSALRGIESPVGSGIYPEPNWLGMIMHDQILYDHGLPTKASQIAGADFDIEFQATSPFAAQANALADSVKAANIFYSLKYPSEVSNNMNNTDSYSFINYCPAISIRDNRRIAEIGTGSNPQWHQTTDVYSSFDASDRDLGFNATATTLGFIARITNAQIINETCSSILPVIGLHVSAIQNQNAIDISWFTEQEINTRNFLLERSYNGRTYSTIRSVAAAGNYPSRTNYEYTDPVTNETSGKSIFYRVRLIDMDGKETMSNVVLLKPRLHTEVRAIPNPFTDKFSLVINSEFNGNMNFYLLNASGNVLLQKNIQVVKGMNQVIWESTDRLSSGIYFIKAEEDEKLLIKLIKIN